MLGSPTKKGEDTGLRVTNGGGEEVTSNSLLKGGVGPATRIKDGWGGEEGPVGKIDYGENETEKAIQVSITE